MKTMTKYDRDSLSELLHGIEFTHAISVNQIDPTVGSIWNIHQEAIQRLIRVDPEIKYFLVVAESLAEKAHGHGMLCTKLTHRQIQSCFKGCNKPVIRNIHDGPRWMNYVLYKNQIIQETELHNINGESQ